MPVGNASNKHVLASIKRLMMHRNHLAVDDRMRWSTSNPIKKLNDEFTLRNLNEVFWRMASTQKRFSGDILLI